MVARPGETAAEHGRWRPGGRPGRTRPAPSLGTDRARAARRRTSPATVGQILARSHDARSHDKTGPADSPDLTRLLLEELNQLRHGGGLQEARPQIGPMLAGLAGPGPDDRDDGGILVRLQLTDLLDSALGHLPTNSPPRSPPSPTCAPNGATRPGRAGSKCSPRRPTSARRPSSVAGTRPSRLVAGRDPLAHPPAPLGQGSPSGDRVTAPPPGRPPHPTRTKWPRHAAAARVPLLGGVRRAGPGHQTSRTSTSSSTTPPNPGAGPARGHRARPPAPTAHPARPGSRGHAGPPASPPGSRSDLLGESPGRIGQAGSASGFRAVPRPRASCPRRTWARVVGGARSRWHGGESRDGSAGATSPPGRRRSSARTDRRGAAPAAGRGPAHRLVAGPCARRPCRSPGPLVR